MNILILSNYHVSLYKQRKELLERLLEKGHTVTIALPYGTYVENMVAMGCRYCPLEFNWRGINPLADFTLLLKIFRLYWTIHPDIVLTYSIKPNIYGGFVAKLLRIPFIVNVTGFGNGFLRGLMFKRFITGLYRLGVSGANVLFLQNQQDASFAQQHRIRGKRNEILPGSGVNLEEYEQQAYPEDTSEIIFLTVARFIKSKGIEELLEVSKRIKKQNRSVRFQLIGEDGEQYLPRIKDACAAGWIEYLGFQSNVRPFLGEAHCLICPSYLEGMSNVLLESAACGRPVIATDIPGCIETFLPGVSGIACKPRDADDLERAVREFLALPYEKKAAMGRTNRIHVEQNFDRNIIVERYLNAIGQIKQESTFS